MSDLYLKHMTLKEVLLRLTMQIMCRKFLNWQNVNATPVHCFCAMSSANDTFITDTYRHYKTQPLKNKTHRMR